MKNEEKWEYLIPLDDFIKAYYECRKRKRYTISASAFEVKYTDKLVRLWRDVNERTYEIGSSKCFIVKYPKLREVFAGNFRDRIVHSLIIDKVNPLFEEDFIEDSYSCREGKGVLYGVTRLYDKIYKITDRYNKDCYIGKFDLKGFFMSIDKDILWEKLNTYITKKYSGDDKELLLWLCEKVVYHCPQYNCVRKSPDYMWERLPKEKSLFTCGDKYGLPIGNLTSQMFANFYLNDFDHFMMSLFGEYYGRYVDDFYVLSENKDGILRAIPVMKKFLKEELGLTLHPDKIYIQHYKMGVKFIGSVVKVDKVYISNSTVSNFYKKIHKFNGYTDKGTHLQEFITTINSYLGFLKHSKAYAIKRKLHGMIGKEWWKYCYAVEHINKLVVKKQYKHLVDN